MRRFLAAAALFATTSLPAQSPPWAPPTAASIRAPERGAGPLLACTVPELDRLRTAFRSGVPAVTAVVDKARKALEVPLVFPPRGGQHNQWYQCDRCQIALRTVDDTHHRCPKCDKVHTGPPYDDVLFARAHGQNLQRALDAAWAFAITGERPFAVDGARILLGYAARYRDYPYHSNSKDPSRKNDSGGHLDAQTLGEASALATRIAPAADLLWPALSTDEHRQLADGLLRPMLENIAKCRRGKSNWQSWHNAAMFAGGVLLGDAAWLQRSIQDPQHGFLFQMRACVSSEGMWYENSFGYHLYTLDALSQHAEHARRAGIDLYAPPLRAMCTLPARYVQADGSLPRFGDDVGTSPQRAARALEAAWAATGDPSLQVALPAEPSFDSVLHGRTTGPATTPIAWRSELFAGAGHAVLRAEGPGGRASATLNFAPFGGFHGHFDKLAFTWHARGSERGVDPGRAASQAYRLPIHEQWYRATVAHNAVVVDGRSQAGAAAELLAFVDGDGYAAAAARLVDGYPGVEHRRCTILVDDRLLVLDLLRSDAAHDYDFVYHDSGTAVRAEPPLGPSPGPVDCVGEPFVEWTGQARTDGPIRAVFDGRKLDTWIAAAAAPGTEVRTGTGPWQSVAERAPLVWLRRRGAKVWFATVLSTVPHGKADEVIGIDCKPAGDGLCATVRTRDGSEVWTWDGAGEPVRSAR